MNEVRKYKSIDGQEVSLIITTPTDDNHENHIEIQTFVEFTLDGSDVTNVVYGYPSSHGFWSND